MNDVGLGDSAGFALLHERRGMGRCYGAHFLSAGELLNGRKKYPFDGWTASFSHCLILSFY